MKEGQTIGQWLNWDSEANGDLRIKNKNGKLIYREFSSGFWVKWEYDSKGSRIYFETSNGEIQDNRPKSCENKEIVIDGEKFKLVKV